MFCGDQGTASQTRGEGTLLSIPVSFLGDWGQDAQVLKSLSPLTCYFLTTCKRLSRPETAQTDRAGSGREREAERARLGTGFSTSRSVPPVLYSRQRLILLHQPQYMPCLTHLPLS